MVPGFGVNDNQGCIGAGIMNVLEIFCAHGDGIPLILGCAAIADNNMRLVAGKHLKHFGAPDGVAGDVHGGLTRGFQDKAVNGIKALGGGAGAVGAAGEGEFNAVQYKGVGHLQDIFKSFKLQCPVMVRGADNGYLPG